LTGHPRARSFFYASECLLSGAKLSEETQDFEARGTGFEPAAEIHASSYKNAHNYRYFLPIRQEREW
jgi:hypothetical protein